MLSRALRCATSVSKTIHAVPDKPPGRRFELPDIDTSSCVDRCQLSINASLEQIRMVMSAQGFCCSGPRDPRFDLDGYSASVAMGAGTLMVVTSAFEDFDVGDFFKSHGESVVSLSESGLARKAEGEEDEKRYTAWRRDKSLTKRSEARNKAAG